MQCRIVAFLFLALLGGCNSSSSESQNKIVRFNIEAEPQTIDPHKARDLRSLTIGRMLFEGLYRVNKQETLEGALAKKVEISDDLKTYTFHLRPSFWSNGEKVTANDFVYAWRKVLDPSFLAEFAFQLYPIKNARAAKEGRVSLEEIGVRALDSYTLQVELAASTPYFLELTAFPTYFPRNEKSEQVGNGPFLLQEWKHNDHIAVIKNRRYWDAKQVHLEKIEMVMLQDDVGYDLFEKRELEWAGSPLSTLPINALASIKGSSQLRSQSLLGTCFLRVNTERKPFCSKELRRAFALALNRQELTEHVLLGFQQPATALIPPVMGIQEGVYFNDGDIEEARALFTPFDCEEAPVLIYGSTERNHLLAQAMQQQWREAFGVRIQLQPLEPKVHLDRLAKKDYDLSIGAWIADFNDPINFLEVFKFKEGSPNNTGWQNGEYIRLLDETMGVKDFQKRRALFRKSEQILLSEMPIIPIFHYTMLYLKSDRLKDVVLSSMGTMDFKWARVEDIPQHE